MRSFGWYEFVGADTAVECFPHINDVYYNISLGVPERYRAKSGVTNTATLRASLAAGPPRQTTICTLIPQEAVGFGWASSEFDAAFSPDLVKQVVVFFCFL